MVDVIFCEAEISVDSDLLSAARATCGTRKGIVAILGTGSNSCYYDGKHITKHIKPLGYILGDEGSGAALGKSLLTQLLRNQLPSQLSESIHAELKMDYDDIINCVYNSEWPNRFIASCTRVLHSKMEEPEIIHIINKEFDLFVDLLIQYESKEKVSFVGSIAYFFKPHLEISLKKKGLSLGEVLKSPAKRLVGYHLEHN